MANPSKVALMVFLVAAFLAGCGEIAPPATPTPTAGALPTSTPPAAPSPSATPGLPTPAPTPTPSPVPTATATPRAAVLLGAGDIAICGQEGDDATASLLATADPDAVFTAGDNSNEDGTLNQYVDCFEPSWGAFKDRLYPSPGNHEYATGNADAYFDYFGPAAGPAGQGYYSYDLGGWHIVALNSNCPHVGGCGVDSQQAQWLREDLAAHPAECTLAYWHHPRWSSGLAGSSGWLRAFWDILYENGAEIVVSGHDHDYERFAPQDPLGQADPLHGVRQFVVGTGGVSQRGFLAPLPNSEARNSGAFGVIQFNLFPNRYEWQFIPAAGESFTDEGSAACHAAPPPVEGS